MKAGHSEQWELPLSGEKDPAVHEAQLEAAPGENCPGRHSVHVVAVVAATWAENVPASHGEHEEAAGAVEKYPRSHCAQRD